MSYDQNKLLSSYIYKLSKKLPGTGMTGDAVAEMNNLVKIVLSLIMQRVSRLLVHSNSNGSGKKTISTKEISSAVNLMFGLNEDHLRKLCIKAGEKAVASYTSSKTKKSDTPRDSGKTAPVPRSTMAGIIFPITRIEHTMMELSHSQRKTETAAVFLSAVLERLAFYILSNANEFTIHEKKVRITPRHIKLCVLSDTELSVLFKDVVMSGGVQQNIESVLLHPPRRKARKARKPRNTEATTTKSKAKATKKQVVGSRSSKRATTKPSAKATSKK